MRQDVFLSSDIFLVSCFFFPPGGMWSPFLSLPSVVCVSGFLPQ